MNERFLLYIKLLNAIEFLKLLFCIKVTKLAVFEFKINFIFAKECNSKYIIFLYRLL
jgi:hypothetical protein